MIDEYILNKYDKNLDALKNKYHRYCMFNNESEYQFKVKFNDEGLLNGHFYGHEKYQGYDNMIHGGVLTALIDSSMAQCLFGHNIVGYTIRMDINFNKPVMINQNIEVISEITKEENQYVELTANIFQNKHKKVTGRGTFWKISD